MGAFFICNKNNITNPNFGLEMFAEMGFASPESFDIGTWKIYAFPKMALSISNTISDNGCTLISTGTPIYKGLNYSDSLRSLLQDFQFESIDTEQLIGQYTILFCRGNTIEILCDPLGSKHLFTDKNHDMLSSHMLPICQCFTSDLHINRKAFYEKLLTGIIMSPNTLFEEITQIDKQEQRYITRENIGISFIQTTNFPISESRARNISECLAEQSNTLREYFKLLNKAGKDGIDIGLSGGYDSRLVLACLHKFNNEKIHLHSHATENVHRDDLMIAKEMAEFVGLPCHTVTTRKLGNSEHVDEILRKSILYFDGRSSFSIGGCGEVYTASYRKESTEGTPFTLTGVGGELYRNVFDIGFRNIHFGRFLEEKVFSMSFRKAISDELYQKIKDDIIGRAATKLGVEKQKKLSKAVAHRYYCEIMMPDGQGTAIDAYNQVSCCIAPFLEPKVIAKGYEAIPYHHSGGEFEGKLIGFIDSGLAAITSTYGYPIGKRPVKAKIKERMRTFIPPSLWNRLADVSSKRKNSFRIDSALEELYANSQMLKEAYTYLTEMFPEINFNLLLHSNEDIRRLQFIAMTIYFFRGRLMAE